MDTQNALRYGSHGTHKFGTASNVIRYYTEKLLNQIIYSKEVLFHRD
jgi:hypothetical protein